MDIKKYIYGHCISPVRVSVWDSYKQCNSLFELPCGKCLHCRNTHINEWVTRLYAQAKYSAHVYYITLDYASFDLTSPVARKLAAETAACYHNINCNSKYGMHPLILEKSHLQNFLKRFRKNTGKKIQYFACGEYGTHAKGHGYGRPHFHLIVFSNDSISPVEFEDAWTLNGYKIGRVDYHDLVANGSFSKIKTKNINDKYNANFVFKYVCKYLQKSDFDFEKLATIDFHRTYFESLCETLADTDTLFPKIERITDKSEIDERWKEYKLFYSPFIVCSRRPSIGFTYFEENCNRFKKQDFRLFGLPKEVSIFPNYYRRKTKESICPYTSIGEISCRPSSNSRLPFVVSVLRQILDMRTRVENLSVSRSDDWYISRYLDKDYLHKVVDGLPTGIRKSDLHLFNLNTKTFYIFNGYDYACWHKYNRIGYEFVGYVPIENVLSIVQPFSDNLVSTVLRPNYIARKQREKTLYDSLVALYGKDDTLDKFKEEVYARYRVELLEIQKIKFLSQNSKISL